MQHCRPTSADAASRNWVRGRNELRAEREESHQGRQSGKSIACPQDVRAIFQPIRRFADARLHNWCTPQLAESLAHAARLVQIDFQQQQEVQRDLQVYWTRAHRLQFGRRSTRLVARYLRRSSVSVPVSRRPVAALLLLRVLNSRPVDNSKYHKYYHFA